MLYTWLNENRAVVGIFPLGYSNQVQTTIDRMLMIVIILLCSIITLERGKKQDDIVRFSKVIFVERFVLLHDKGWERNLVFYLLLGLFKPS